MAAQLQMGPAGRYAAWGFYLIVGFEILYMISPFGLYFYSAYGPVLRYFDARPQTAWLTDFFLPHFSETSSAFLNGVVNLSAPVFLVGLTLFAVGFVSIYSTKLLRRGQPVTFLLYRWIRHPQYVAVALMGLGMLLLWPRVFVLVAFVTMLFLYYFLARSEEQRCLAKFGDSYRQYMERTWGFLPGWGQRGSMSGLQSKLSWRHGVVALGAWAVLVAASVWGAYRLREYSLARVSHTSSQDVAIISPALLSRDELSQAVNLAAQEPNVSSRLQAAGYGRGGKLLVYVVPAEWLLPDLPMETPKKIGGHHTPKRFEHNRFKVLFTRAVSFRGDPQGDDIIRATVKRQPIILARINVAAGAVEAIEQPPATVRWGDIPTPLF